MAGRHTTDIQAYMSLANSARLKPKRVNFARTNTRKFTDVRALTDIVDRKLAERRERHEARSKTLAFTKMDNERRKSLREILF